MLDVARGARGLGAPRSSRARASRCRGRRARAAAARARGAARHRCRAGAIRERPTSEEPRRAFRRRVRRSRRRPRSPIERDERRLARGDRGRARRRARTRRRVPAGSFSQSRTACLEPRVVEIADDVFGRFERDRPGQRLHRRFVPFAARRSSCRGIILFTRMEASDLVTRNVTYGLFLAFGHAPTADSVASALGTTRDDVQAAWRRLEDEHALVLERRTPEIRMANPLSAVPSAYRVKCRGALVVRELRLGCLRRVRSASGRRPDREVVPRLRGADQRRGAQRGFGRGIVALSLSSSRPRSGGTTSSSPEAR